MKKEYNIKPLGELVDEFIGELKDKDHKPDRKEKRIRMIYKIAMHKLGWDKKRTFGFIMEKFPGLAKRLEKELPDEKLHYSLGAAFLMMDDKEMRRVVRIFLQLEKKHGET